MSASKLRTHFSNRVWVFLILSLILFVAAFLRFRSVTERGLFSYDEAVYLLEAKFVRDGITQLASRLDLFVQRQGQGDDWESSIPGRPLAMAKPGHTFLILLGSFLLGFQDYTGAYVSGFGGVLTVLFVFLLGRILFDLRTGLLASAILAVSGYHIMYSRSNFAEAPSIFFLLLSTYFYYRAYQNRKSINVNLILSGFFAGYALTCNWRLLLIPIYFLLYEIVSFLLDRSINFVTIIRRVSTWLILMFTPLFIFELPYLIVMGVKGSLPFPSYLQQLLERFTEHHGYFSIESWYVYIAYLWHLNGALFLVLFFAGLIVLIYKLFVKFEMADFIVFSQAVLPLVLFSIYTSDNKTRVARAISIGLPAMALISGRFMSLAFEKVWNYFSNDRQTLKWAEAPLILIIILLLVIGVYNSKAVINLKSGYREAVKLVLDQTLTKVGSRNYIWTFYLGEKNHLYTGAMTLPQLGDLHEKQGLNFFIVDYTKYVWKNLYPEYFEYFRRIENKYKPVLAVSNKITNFVPILSDENIAPSAITALQNDPLAKQIIVYDLRSDIQKP